MSQESSSPLIVPLSRGWKRSERSSQDTEPILWKEPSTASNERRNRNSGGNDDSKQPTPCSVCRQNESRYTCPRCQSPYCSVECYRNHTTAASASVSASSEASACTETFYQNRVASIQRLEAFEQKDNTKQMLNEQYAHLNQDNEVVSDELYEILQALEEQESDDSMTQEQLLSLMSPALRATFQSDLQNGKMHELIVEAWHPWWRRELGGASTATAGDEGNPPASSSAVPDTTITLDERLLQVPHFSLLFRKGNPPQLLYNLIEILYSTCWTLRLYHGVRNASHLLVEASATLVASSSVLNKDARYTTLEQVFSECTASSTLQYPAGCNTHWTVLAEDCALLVSSHRLLGRAVLEVSDLLKAAIKQMKKQQTSEDDEEVQGNINRLRRIRKKLEFYLSWSQQAAEPGEDIKNEILAWIESWKVSNERAEEALDNFQIPEDARSGKPLRKPPSDSDQKEKNRSPSPPLMVEVETRRSINELD